MCIEFLTQVSKERMRMYLFLLGWYKVLRRVLRRCFGNGACKRGTEQAETRPSTHGCFSVFDAQPNICAQLLCFVTKTRLKRGKKGKTRLTCAQSVASCYGMSHIACGPGSCAPVLGFQIFTCALPRLNCLIKGVWGLT